MSENTKTNFPNWAAWYAPGSGWQMIQGQSSCITFALEAGERETIERSLLFARSIIAVAQEFTGLEPKDLQPTTDSTNKTC